MRSISISTVSPSRIVTGGSRKIPTPEGVPVRITSPGSSVNAPDACAMSVGTSKIRSLVFASCSVSPLSRCVIRRPRPSPSSSTGTSSEEERPERVEALRAHPLPVLALDRPRADVVSDRVPGDVRERVRGVDPPSAFADHDRELRLRVDMRVLARKDDRLARSDERRRELREQDRRFRRLTPSLGRVVDVVQPSARSSAERRPRTARATEPRIVMRAPPREAPAARSA